MNLNKKEKEQVLTSRSVSSLLIDNLAVGLEDKICCSQPSVRARILPTSNTDNLRQFLQHRNYSISTLYHRKCYLTLTPA